MPPPQAPELLATKRITAARRDRVGAGDMVRDGGEGARKGHTVQAAGAIDVVHASGPGT